MADEAHRSQYGLEAKFDRQTGKVSYGFAKHMRDALPNASFIGFTGTPIENADVNTRSIFGDYIDIYDIAQDGVDGLPAASMCHDGGSLTIRRRPSV
nr:hypothetical protein [Acetobacter pasteurianus]